MKENSSVCKSGLLAPLMVIASALSGTGLALVSTALGGCDSHSNAEGNASERVGRSAQALIATEQAKLIASDAWFMDRLGESVSISGDTALVGAPGKSQDSGAAYVWIRSGTTWSEQAKLTAPDSTGAVWFGSAVAISGDTAIIAGAPYYGGGTYIFARVGSTWSVQAKLVPEDPADSDSFGQTVDISGDTAIVGAPQSKANAGAAYVFKRSGSTWSPQAKLVASDGAPDDTFGISLSLSGDTTVIGARGKNQYTGAAYVFVRNGESWSQQAELVSNDAETNDNLGYRVGVSGDTALVMSGAKDGVFVFVRSGGSWSQQAMLTALDGDPNDNFGKAIAISGDVAVVGAPFKAGNAGAAYAFVRTGTTWTQSNKLTASDGAPKDLFAIAVGMSNETVIIGAPRRELPEKPNAGAAYVFTLEPEPPKTCVSASDCETGFCVDGVCCDTACGGDSKTDCHVCSKAAGAAEDGICAPLPYGTICDDGNACTLIDTCGAASVCAGTAVFDGTPCSSGACKSGVCTAVPDASVDAESGSGGAPGTGGASGIGGSVGAFDPKDTVAGVEGASVDGGGCGCRAAGERRGSMAWLIAFCLGAAGGRRRKIRATTV